MSTSDTLAPAVHRIVITKKPDAPDPEASSLVREAEAIGTRLAGVWTSRVFLLQGELTDEQIEQITAELLVDPVLETATCEKSATGVVVEVHPLPGVMDPVAQSVASAVETLTGTRPAVQTAHRYTLKGISQKQAHTLAERLLANTVVHHIHDGSYHPDSLPAGTESECNLTHVTITTLDDTGLETLSRDGHLFLDLHEMQAIRSKYQELGREPTDIELETLAQTWSEHCVHKTLKSTIHYTGPEGDTIDWLNRPGHIVNDDGSVTINNLLKSTVAAATFELIEEGLDWTLSVFVDNAGIIEFDDNHAVCIKVETHNHPSAIEPYGGAATGIGGCIRDIMGTGLAAKPIASTDVFCVGPQDMQDVPAGCLPPDRVLKQVVAGVRDYGNRMGIPTINGAVWFDERYVGNPLVYCGCVGVMPKDLIGGDAKPGDLIVALGGRTGRDGIHGATFSSAELTDTHADEFNHAVQIGNAIEEKRVLDATLRARDHESGPLFTAVTDCGAGGFSSAVGEMGEKVGASVHLDRAPLKYAGLTYSEIWISEAQERMVFAVPQDNLAKFQAICDEEHAELAVLGEFGQFNDNNEPELVLNFHNNEVGRMPMPFLHDGIPTPTRTAKWTSPKRARDTKPNDQQPSTTDALLRLLAHPNIASKRSIIRQYDHEVQGNVVLKPLVGPGGIGPGDASVIEPVPGSGKGLAIGCGLATNLGDPALGGDPYQMALAAIDECVRNLVCVGANPDRIAILDNFCWPSCKKPENLASLVRAAEGCYDGAKAYKTPFVSGKDSLNNQFTTQEGRTIEIPPTLLITGMGIVDDVTKCVTMDLKQIDSKIAEIGIDAKSLSHSHYSQIHSTDSHNSLLPVDLRQGPKIARALSELIQQGLVLSSHDISEGGMLVALAEMLIASANSSQHLGVDVDEESALDYFGEGAGRYLIEYSRDAEQRIADTLAKHGVMMRHTGAVTDSGKLNIPGQPVDTDKLVSAWNGEII
ncbi:MAG: phosphoribosylformylglycinamidine synthase [Phycisphaera sp.]|nr:MAG: phosphoribosylformylglycinamidine synthase [Phycisphaera sp.]